MEGISVTETVTWIEKEKQFTSRIIDELKVAERNRIIGKIKIKPPF